jgi:hypothetical protein
MALDEQTKKFISRLSEEELKHIYEDELTKYTEEEILFIGQELQKRGYKLEEDTSNNVSPSGKKKSKSLIYWLIIIIGVATTIYRDSTTRDENKIRNSNSPISSQQQYEQPSEEKLKNIAIKLVQNYDYGKQDTSDTLLKTLAIQFKLSSNQNIYEFKGWGAEKSSDKSEYIFRVTFYYTENTIDRSISWAVDVKNQKVVPVDQMAKDLMGIPY